MDGLLSPAEVVVVFFVYATEIGQFSSFRSDQYRKRPRVTEPYAHVALNDSVYYIPYLCNNVRVRLDRCNTTQGRRSRRVLDEFVGDRLRKRTVVVECADRFRRFVRNGTPPNNTNLSSYFLGAHD